jgi:hypothetical protein
MCSRVDEHGGASSELHERELVPMKSAVFFRAIGDMQVMEPKGVENKVLVAPTLLVMRCLLADLKSSGER